MKNIIDIPPKDWTLEDFKQFIPPLDFTVEYVPTFNEYHVLVQDGKLKVDSRQIPAHFHFLLPGMITWWIVCEKFDDLPDKIKELWNSPVKGKL